MSFYPELLLQSATDLLVSRTLPDWRDERRKEDCSRTVNNSVVVRADLVARLATRLVRSEVAGGLNTCGRSPSWEAEGRATAGGSGGFTWRSQTLQSPRAEVLSDFWFWNAIRDLFSLVGNTIARILFTMSWNSR